MLYLIEKRGLSKIPPPPKNLRDLIPDGYDVSVVKAGYPEQFCYTSGLYYMFICENCGATSYAEFTYARSPVGPDKINAHRGSNSPMWERIIMLEDITYDAKEKLFSDAQKAYHKSLKKGVRCPICNAKINPEGDLFLTDKRADSPFALVDYTDHYDNYSHSRHTETLENNYNAVTREQANALVSTYSKSCDVFFSDAAPQKAAEIKADNEMLRNYILHLIRLENNIYSLEKRLPELYYQRLLNDRAIVFSTREPLYSLKKEIEEHRSTYKAALEAVQAAERYEPKVSVKKPSEPKAPVLATPGLFNKKKVLAENEVLTAKYQAELKKYEEDVRRCNEKTARLIAEEKAKVLKEAVEKAEAEKAALEAVELHLSEKTTALQELPVPAMAAKELLDKEISEAEALLQKSYAARNELYAYNVIFGKYRNIVALSSIYEYLMSGRCVSLEGADGAYNIYEGEIRADRIIAQLDAVNSSLDQIKQNQYMLYSEMSSVNSSLDSLNKTMDEALTSIKNMEVDTKKISKNSNIIAKNTAAIAYSTEVTAYYSKKTAELTNALGYMVAFK